MPRKANKPRHPPYCAWYIDEWLANAKVQAMSAMGRGAHFQLLMQSWTQAPACTIPGDDEQIATLAGMQLTDWMAVKFSVLACWKKLKSGRYRNSRLFTEFRKSSQMMKAKSAQASQAAKAMWRKRRQEMDLQNNKGDAPSMRPAYPEHANRDRDRDRDTSDSDSVSSKNRANTPSDSGLGVEEIDRLLVRIQKSLQVYSPQVRAHRGLASTPQGKADWTDWECNIEPAVRKAIHEGHTAEWFALQAKQAGGGEKPVRGFRTRLKNAGIEVGSAKKLRAAK